MMVCDAERNGKLNSEQMQGHGNFVTFDSYGRLQTNFKMSDDKPFACRVPGCNQKFVNEDHLEVHRKKHDIHLGLSDFKSLDTPVIADQTPTPTRFLKNLAGEEGLFSDLHPNPFDAEFRKASSKLDTDDGRGGSETPVDMTTTLTSMESQATNNSNMSERIMLASSEEEVKSEQGTIELEHPQTVGDIRDSPELPKVKPQTQQAAPTVVVVSQPAQTLQLQGLSNQLALSGIPLNGPIMIKLPTGQTIPVLPQSVTNPQVPIPTAVSANPGKEPKTSGSSMDGKPVQSNSVKLKLKSTLLSNQSQGNMNVMAQAVDVVTKQQEVKLLSKAPTSDYSQQEISYKRQRSDDDEDNDTKRQKFLERNRAAASRCRNKRKQWITDLEKRADELNSTNNVLNNEVGKLRNEVAQLKELLLAHKDCPVTLQQRAAGLFMTVGNIPGRPEQEQETSGVITISTTLS